MKETVGTEETIYSYNGLNQLTRKNGKDGETVYSYDKKGNQISETNSTAGTVNTLTYDAADRLSRYERTENGTVVLTQENCYNGEGSGFRKRRPEWIQSDGYCRGGNRHFKLLFCEKID